MLFLMGCLAPMAEPVVLSTPTASTATQTPVPPSLTATQIPTLTAIPSFTPTPEPLGCQKPPEDYTRVQVDGQTLNQRTLAMLAHAQELYSGELELTGSAITQGSYTDAAGASFGTHAGGGAVDLSVLRRETYTVLWDDLEPLIRALRVAGFAAWVRDYGELYADSPIHIHAIAIGYRGLPTATVEGINWKKLHWKIYTCGTSAITSPGERYQFRIRIMAHTDRSHKDHAQRDRLHCARVGW